MQVDTGELYDVVNTRATSGVSVQALRTLWDKKPNHNSAPGNNQRVQLQTEPPAVHPPALPLKSKSRKLTGAVSVDTTSLAQVGLELTYVPYNIQREHVHDPTGTVVPLQTTRLAS